MIRNKYIIAGKWGFYLFPRSVGNGYHIWMAFGMSWGFSHYRQKGYELTLWLWGHRYSVYVAGNHQHIQRPC